VLVTDFTLGSKKEDTMNRAQCMKDLAIVQARLDRREFADLVMWRSNHHDRVWSVIGDQDDAIRALHHLDPDAYFRLIADIATAVHTTVFTQRDGSRTETVAPLGRFSAVE
jgi:hypothetical protein